MTPWRGAVVVDEKAAVEGREVWHGGCKVTLPRQRRFYKNFTMVELWRWHEIMKIGSGNTRFVV